MVDSHPPAANLAHAGNSSSPHSSRCLVVAVGVMVVCYAIALFMGWPQHATAQIVDEAPIDVSAAAHSPDQSATNAPPLYAVVPFVMMLGAIAVLPLIHGTKHWWENNLHRFYLAAALAILTLLYYALLHAHPVVGHFPALHVSSPQEGESIHWRTIGTVLANSLLNEYVPFITLLFSLYTISGGIRIEGDLRAHPSTNLAFLSIGAVLASFIGTTGAAMILIRPLLETNRERKHVAHTVVLFIFIVCNCGGCLLPLGDPPLFLGYLEGVPFLWTLTLWKHWLFINSALLAIYWAWDHFYFYPREMPLNVVRDKSSVKRLQFGGLKLNGLLLIGVVFATALFDPSKPFPGTQWHAWLYLREVVLLSLVALSLLFSSPGPRLLNHFNFAPIVEVAVLFFGIFICMQPALEILSARGSQLALDNPTKFFWATGTLSSFLDNAPTYLVFFEAANSLTHTPGPGVLALQSGHFIREDLLAAISLGAVFMGAMTYIGNGPNFMVKSIAESFGVRMPTFFGYLFYSCAIFLPLLLIIQLMFLR
jgi:Na+/H+ antiporter NhaD/arsenite permease-like protein